MGTVRSVRRALIPVCLTAAILAGASSALIGTCGPFTDEAADAFCPFVLEIFYLGITTGTTATTFDPTSNVSRLQMAAFLSRTVDGPEAREPPSRLDHPDDAERDGSRCDDVAAFLTAWPPTGTSG